LRGEDFGRRREKRREQKPEEWSAALSIGSHFQGKFSKTLNT
tara:strand:- start:158 stop:283 length:126 start_codon:yes stop_codon:yes gene_type:complete